MLNMYENQGGMAGSAIANWILSLFDKDKAAAAVAAQQAGNKPVSQLYKESKKSLSAEQKEIFEKFFPAIEAETRKKGGALSDADLKKIIGKDNWKWWRDDTYDELYNSWYNEAGAALLSPAAKEDAAKEAAQQSTYSIDAFIKMMNEKGLAPQNITLQQMGLGDLTEQGLTIDYQKLLDAQNAVVNQQYAAEMQELDRAESDMYRSIGMSQRMMERDIAKRRQQALKSGMSTAQLAAQEQQNILAAQTGAAQIAQQFADQRYGVISQFAGAGAQNYASMLAQQQQYAQSLDQYNNNLINQQSQFNAQQQANWASTLASIYGQNYASDKYENQFNNTK